MTKEELHQHAEEAKKLIATWPAWKRAACNLSNWLSPTVPVPRKPIINE